MGEQEALECYQKNDKLCVFVVFAPVAVKTPKHRCVKTLTPGLVTRWSSGHGSSCEKSKVFKEVWKFDKIIKELQESKQFNHSAL